MGTGRILFDLVDKGEWVIRVRFVPCVIGEAVQEAHHLLPILRTLQRTVVQHVEEMW